MILNIGMGRLYGLLAHFPYFEDIKGGLCDHLAVYLSLPQRLEPEETVIARQRLGRHVPRQRIHTQR
jgi:hypothetical protein